LSDAGKREWRFYLDDMIEFAERNFTYTDGFERAGLATDGTTATIQPNHRHSAPPPSFRA
jgi:uncharacterized protein with HEPN domain